MYQGGGPTVDSAHSECITLCPGDGPVISFAHLGRIALCMGDGPTVTFYPQGVQDYVQVMGKLPPLPTPAV